MTGSLKHALVHLFLNQFKSDRFKRLGKEFAWIVLGQGATVLGALVGVRILTGLLAPAEYGQLALGMTAATLIQTVVLGPLGNGATRFYAPACEANSLHTYLAAVRRMTLISTSGIILFALLLGFGFALTGMTRWIGMGIAALVFALLTCYNVILSGIQNAARQRAIVALHQGIATWGRFLVAAGLILWLGASSTLAMVGYALGMLFVLASQYWFFRRIITPPGSVGYAGSKTATHWQVQIFKYSWPFATWGLLSWGRTVADRWGLEVLSSTDDVGLYSVLFQLGYYPIAMLFGMVTTLLAPIYFQRAGNASDTVRVNEIFNLGWKITLYAIMVMLGVTIISFFLHRPIFSLLVAKEYIHISYLLPGILLAAGLYESTRFLTIVLQAQNVNSILIVPTNVAHLVSMLLIFAGAAWNGLEGVVIAYIVQAFIPLIWMIAIFKKQQRLLMARIF